MTQPVNVMPDAAVNSLGLPVEGASQLEVEANQGTNLGLPVEGASLTSVNTGIQSSVPYSSVIDGISSSGRSEIDSTYR
jgi:hypothetical protein